MNKTKINNDLNSIVQLSQSIFNEVNSTGGGGVIRIEYGNLIDVGTILATSSGIGVLSEPYTPMEVNRSDNKYRIWYYGWGQHLSCVSDTALPGSFVTAGVEGPAGGNPNQFYGAISCEKFLNKYWHCKNGEINLSLTKKYFFNSTDGIYWNRVVLPVDLWLGEDHSFMIDSDSNSLCFFVRPHLPNEFHNDNIRHIDLKISQDGKIWSESTRLFTGTINKQYYSMTACKIKDQEYFGCVNVYDTVNDCVFMELYRSTNLISWQKILEVPRFGMKQQYGQVSYCKREKKIYLLVSCSKNSHNQRLPENKFRMDLFKIEVREITE